MTDLDFAVMGVGAAAAVVLAVLALLDDSPRPPHVA